MTIEELKDKKRKLEEEIAEKIMAFEKDTGVEISVMDIVNNLGYDQPIDIEVKIEVKI